MPRGLFNWKFDQVVTVLRKHGFILNHSNGSHFYYVGHHDGILRQVCVPFHGKKELKPRTMRGIILQSGIPKTIWLK